jgi:hypothetical protein
LCGGGFMDFIHRPKSKILKILKKLKSQSQLLKRCNFNFLIFLIFYSSEDG